MDRLNYFVYAGKFVLTHLHKRVYLVMVGLMLMYKMSESHFLSFFSSTQNDRHKLRPGGKEETWPIKTFIALPTHYNGIFMMLLYKPPLS